MSLCLFRPLSRRNLNALQSLSSTLSRRDLRPSTYTSVAPFAISPIKLQHSKCSSRESTSPAQLSFWSSRPSWKRASVNTIRCLIGCTIGDFSAFWYLQTYHASLGVGITMAASMASGIATSLLLETLLLRFGRDRLAWSTAFNTAAGMSLVSMLTMEAVENAVDYHLTGGVVAFGDPAFWFAAALSVAAGFIAPLPWNYYRLRLYGKSCH